MFEKHGVSRLMRGQGGLLPCGVWGSAPQKGASTQLLRKKGLGGGWRCGFDQRDGCRVEAHGGGDAVLHTIILGAALG